MFCEKCGKEIKDNSKFCKYCGTKYDDSESTKQSQHENKSDHNNEGGTLSIIIIWITTFMTFWFVPLGFLIFSKNERVKKHAGWALLVMLIIAITGGAWYWMTNVQGSLQESSGLTTGTGTNTQSNNVQVCTPQWSCTAWSTCSQSGTQDRTCTDTNNCGATTGRPSLTQSCTYLSPAEANYTNCKNAIFQRECTKVHLIYTEYSSVVSFITCTDDGTYTFSDITDSSKYMQVYAPERSIKIECGTYIAPTNSYQLCKENYLKSLCEGYSLIYTEYSSTVGFATCTDDGYYTTNDFMNSNAYQQVMVSQATIDTQCGV